MAWKEMIRSKEFKAIIIFGFILFIFGVGLHITGWTFLNTDQIYCRGFYPWKDLAPKVDCDQERDGDHIFESAFIASELDYLSENPHQNSYTERIMNGYPIAAAYTGNPYTLTRLFNNFLPLPSSVNFASLFYLFTSFFVGYLIARRLGFAIIYALLFGFFSITSSYVFLIESYNMCLLGFLLLGLAFVEYHYHNNKYLFLILSFLGSVFIILSAFFQLYLYAAICVLLLLVLSLFGDQKKKLVLMSICLGAIFLSTSLIFNLFLEQHLSFLAVSNKTSNNVSFSEFLKHKDYSFDPLGWIGREPVEMHRKAVALLFGDNFGYEKYGSMTLGLWSPGPAFLAFFFIGLKLLWSRYRVYVLFSVFWLLYSAGFIQLILSLIVGSPFLEETSVRASNIFFPLAIFAVIYAVQQILMGGYVISRKIRIVLWLVFGYISTFLPIFIIFRYLGHKQVLLESVFISISSILFLTWLLFSNSNLPRVKKITVFMLVVSFLLPSFGRLFLGANPVIFTLNKSALYYPETTFGKNVSKVKGLNRIALIETSSSGRILHQNSPLYLGLNTITGYRNPMYANYADLFYFHRFIFDGSLNPTANLTQLKTSVSYLNNDLGSLKVESDKVYWSEATKRYFGLTGVNAVIGPSSLVIQNPEWQKVASGNNLSLWKSTKPATEFFLVSKEVIIEDEIGRLRYIFENPTWDPTQSVVIQAPKLQQESNDKGGGVRLVAKKDGYRLFETNNLGNNHILTIPVTFDKHWTANYYGTSTPIKLETFVSNIAFLGILIPKGSGTVEVVYDDKPKTINYLISGVGILILLSICICFRKRNNTIQSSPPEQE